MFLDAGCLPDTFHGKSYFASPKAMSMRGKQKIIRFLRRALFDPFIQELLYLRMKWDVPIVMHLSQWHTEPVVFADLDHAVGGEVKEFTLAHPGQNKSDAAQPGKQVRMSPCRLHEFRRGYLIQKSRRGSVQDRKVPGKYEYPLGGLRPLPFRPPF
jgi:hypothetical protein